MEKLEKKLEAIVEANYKKEDDWFDFDRKECSRDLASEVEFIVIAFAEYRDDHNNDVNQGFASKKDDKELFQDFISNYYK